MADLFGGEGITFVQGRYASTAPSASPAPISVQGSGAARESVSQSNMTGAEADGAVLDLYGDTPAPEAGFRETLTAASDTAAPAVPAPKGRDLFGGEPPESAPASITETNTNAFTSGVILEEPADGKAIYGDGYLPDVQAADQAAMEPKTQTSTAPISRATMSSPPGSALWQQREVVKYADEDRKQMDLLAQTRFSPEQLAEWKNKPIGFWEAFSKLKANQVVPGGGVGQLAGSLEIVDIAKKHERGEQLTPDDQKQLNDYLDRQIELSQRGFSWGGNIAYIGSQIPAFVVEFALSDGVGKTAQVAATKTAVTAAGKIATRSAGVAARVSTTTALMAPQYTARYGERRLNDISAITDRGELVMKDSEESPAKSALLAFGHTGAEVASEMSGATIGKRLIDPIAGKLKTPLVAALNRLPTSTKAALYEAYKKINPNAQVSKVFSAVGWHGMLAELGEERVADVLHASLNLASEKKYTTEDFLDNITPSKDQLAVEGGLIAIAGGVHTSADITMNILKRRGMTEGEARETVDNMTALETEQFAQDNLPTPSSSYVPIRPDIPIEAPVDLPEVDLPKLSEAAAESYPWQEAARSNIELQPEGKPAEVTPEADVVSSQISAAEKVEPPAIDNSESFFNRAYRDMVNDMQPIHELTEKARARGAEITPMNDPKLLSSLYSQNIEIASQQLQVATSNWGPDGNRVITGKSLKATMDDFDNYFYEKEPNIEARNADFHDYLVAERYLELLKEDKNENTRVTPEQQAKAMADLVRLGEKYGEDFRMMGEMAKEVYEFQDRIVQNLVTSGVMSQETYDLLKGKYSKYVPLQRIMDEPQFSDAISKGPFSGASSKSVIKRLRGSEREVKDVFHSIMKNTVKIMDLAARNKVAQSVADLAEHLPEYIQKAKPIIVKKGTADFKVSYDPKLREKLEKTIEVFGNRIERNKSVKVKGYKNVLGSYSPMEKAVRMKLGTTEGTLAHEVGHMLDFELGLDKLLLKKKGVRAELEKLAEDRLSSEHDLVHTEEGIRFEETKNDIGSDKYIAYIKNSREIIANFFDAYVNSPDQARRVAPKAVAEFEKIIDADPALAFLKDIKPSTSRREETIQKDVYGEADFGPQNSIEVYRDGKREHYTVARPLYEAMTQLTPAQIGVTEKILAAPFRVSAQILRAGATLTPEFALRNAVRDQLTASLQSGVGYTPQWFMKGLFASIGRGDLYNQWVSSGGKFASYMSLDDDGIQKAYKELMRPSGRLYKYLNPLKAMEQLVNYGEQGTRIGVFAAAKKKGLSDIEAAYASLEATLNFARGGKVGRRMNRYIPFFNAGIQGVDKMVRSFKANPAALTFWGVATITIPSVVITGYYLYGAPEDERNEFLEIPQWQRDMFWVFKVDGEWHSYPKPFGYGYYFGSMPERMMQWLYAGDKPEGKTFWEETLKGLAGTVSPINDWSSAFPPLAKAAIENATNYNFFMGRDIYPAWMERLEPEQRFKKYNTESAKQIGKVLNASPAKIENTVQTLAGGTGKYALKAGDYILDEVKKWNGETVPEMPVTNADMMLIKAFSIRSPGGFGSNSGQNFMDTYTVVEQKHNTLKKLEGEEQANYQRDNARDLAVYPALKGAYKAMQAEQKQIDAIYDHKSMTSEEKLEAIRRHEKVITEIARNANKQYNAATKD